MYTIPPSKPPSPPRYAHGLGFIAVTLPLMMGAAWVYGNTKHTPVFYALTMGMIPLFLGGWPLAVTWRRQRYTQRHHSLVLAGLAISGAIGYFVVLIGGTLLFSHAFQRMVFAVGDTVFQSRFNLKVGSWVTRWLEAGIAWSVVMNAVIFFLRRWHPSAEMADSQ